nr:unnamed protein product [Callosobruchus chinensis]
MMASTWLLT